MTRNPITTRRVALLIGLAAVAAGCAGAGARGPEPQDRTMLLAEEIDASGYTDAFSLVQALRPQWLRTRGQSSLTQREFVQVYLDGSRMGGPETLRQVPVTTIRSMQYLSGLEATQRWGLDHGSGAIVVLTRH